jgi:dTDP-4-amino-4,6-dideoxygalactose transaminase
MMENLSDDVLSPLTNWRPGDRHRFPHLPDRKPAGSRMPTLYPRMVLDFGAGDLFRLAFLSGRETLDMAAIDRRLAGGRPFAVALSVRTAFDLLLTELGIQPDDEIVLSAINIRGMVSIAHDHGLKVRVADIDPATLAVPPEEVERLLTGRTRLVVVAPTFGARHDLSEIAAICRARSIPLVEDAAQTWEGSYRGSPDADVVLFSFGPAKTATALGGAVALFRDPQAAERFRRAERDLPPTPALWLPWRIAKFAVFRLFLRPTLMGVVDRLGRLLGIDTDAAFSGAARSFPQSKPMAAIRRRLPARMRHLMAHKLAVHPGAEARRRRALEFAGLLEKPDAVPGAACPDNSFWLTAVTAAGPEALVEALRAAGFDASRKASNIAALADDETGPPPRAAAMMASLVYLPLTRYTGPGELARIAAIVNRNAAPEGS